MSVRGPQTGWVGWAVFAGVMMIILGAFEGIAGLTALLANEQFVVTQERLLVFDFTTWGWIHLMLGVVVMLAGFAVFAGQTWGRIIGITVAGLSAVGNLAFLTAHPVWSMVIITVDVLVIYALAVHGGELRES